MEYASEGLNVHLVCPTLVQPFITINIETPPRRLGTPLSLPSPFTNPMLPLTSSVGLVNDRLA